MSTKTTIKRIALVAAVAAAFGGLSTVAANASAAATGVAAASYPSAATGWSIGLAGSGVSTASSSTGLSTAATQVVGGVVNATFTFPATGTAGSVEGSFTSTGVGTVVATGVATTGGTNPSISGTLPESSFTVTSGSSSASDTVTVQASSAVAGVQTLSMSVIGANGAPTGSYTATITWGSAPVVSAQFSTAYINLSSTILALTADTTSTLTASKSASSATPVALIGVTLNSAAATPISGAGLAVSVTGPGSLGLKEVNAALVATDASNSAYASTTEANTGRGLSITATGSTPYYVVALYPDGTAGTSTITITSGTTTIATKTFVFTGSASKVTATQNLKVLKAGGAVDTLESDLAAGKVYDGSWDAAYAGTVLTDGGAAFATPTVPWSTASTDIPTAPITVFTTDSAGNPVTLSDFSSASIKVVVSDKSVLTAQACTQVTHAAPIAGVTPANEINCAVTGTVGAASGATATATVELYNSTTAAWDIVSAPLTFTIGGAIAKEVLSTDAATYAPNQPMKLVVTATDKAGNAAYDQDATLVGTAKASTYQVGLAGLPTELIGGTGTSAGLYAPATEGAFTISGVDATTALNAISVTATVGGGAASTAASAATDAANEATDAANAATDAANAAADAADAATAAAQDAGAKADAALAAVTALSAKITVLAAQIAKIVKKLGA